MLRGEERLPRHVMYVRKIPSTVIYVVSLLVEFACSQSCKYRRADASFTCTEISHPTMEIGVVLRDNKGQLSHP